MVSLEHILIKGWNNLPKERRAQLLDFEDSLWEMLVRLSLILLQYCLVINYDSNYIEIILSEQEMDCFIPATMIVVMHRDK